MEEVGLSLFLLQDAMSAATCLHRHRVVCSAQRDSTHHQSGQQGVFSVQQGSEQQQADCRSAQGVRWARTHRE